MKGRLALLGGLLLVLCVVSVVPPPTTERQVPLTVYSAEPAGGKALRLWLEALGYPVSTLEGSRYAVDRDVGTVLLLAPARTIAPEARVELERWTRQGGRLVVATDGYQTWELLRRFGVSTRVTSEITQAVPSEAGALDPAIERIRVETRLALDLSEGPAGAVPLLLGTLPDTASEGERRPILAARIPADRGELIVVTVPDALSNAGLRSEVNARLALSLVGPVGRGRVAFDELHHGFGALQHRTMIALLTEQAWGRAIVLAGGVVLLFLLWQGRRFGRAVPVFVDRGRSLGELVTSQAGLYRAGGKRAFVAEHLARQLRGEVAQALGLPSGATDAEIAARATASGRDPSRVLRLLAMMQQARSDRELLRLAREGVAASAELTTMRRFDDS